MWNIFKREPSTPPEQQFNIEPWEFQTLDTASMHFYEFKRIYANIETPLAEAIKNDDIANLSSLLKALPANELFLFMDTNPDCGTAEWGEVIQSLDNFSLFIYARNWLARTDWFSAAVYMQSQKIIEWAINSGHATINRNVAPFFVSKKFLNTDIKTFQGLCFSGQVSDFSKYITRENRIYWTQTKNLKTIPGTADWLKCKLFEATPSANNPTTSNSFGIWMSNETLANPATLSMNMNTVLGCRTLGCEPNVFLEIMDWLQLRCGTTNTNFYELKNGIERLCLEDKFKQKLQQPSKNLAL